MNADTKILAAVALQGGADLADHLIADVAARDPELANRVAALCHSGATPALLITFGQQPILQLEIRHDDQVLAISKIAMATPSARH